MYQLKPKILEIWRQLVRGRLLPLLLTVRGLGFLIAALALWLFYLIAEEVLEQETLGLDTSILLRVQQWHTPWLDRVMLSLTALGDPSMLLLASAVLAGFLLWRRRRADMTVLAIAAIGAFLLNTLLKILFARHRPELWQRTVEVRFYSFPSGHAMISFVIYGLVGYLLAGYFKRWRVQIAVLTILLIGAIGFSRLYLGVHWPTDVVAGYAAGAIWLMTCILSLEIWRQRYRVAGNRSSEASSQKTAAEE